MCVVLCVLDQDEHRLKVKLSTWSDVPQYERKVQSDNYQQINQTLKLLHTKSPVMGGYSVGLIALILINKLTQK